uniref:Uncharacterized protein n=1 Tax=Setaria italica TaxID=4555 RepID=K4AP66_SETIT
MKVDRRHGKSKAHRVTEHAAGANEISQPKLILAGCEN